MRFVVVGLAVALFASAASAQSMNAEQFYQRGAKLKAKGPLALFSMGEIKALTAEGQAAGEAARANRLAAEKAGKRARYCPPPGKVSMNSEEFFNRLAAIPQAKRRQVDMTEATTIILANKFPCR